MHPAIRKRSWIVLVLLLVVWIVAPSAHAQFRSAESSSRPDSVQSLAPTPLGETRSLDAYVHDADVLRPTAPRPDDSRRYDPVLTREQKLLWGTVGLVMHSICDSDWEDDNPMKPYPLLDAGERRCVECNRMGERAFDAVLEGVFSSDSERTAHRDR